MKTKIPLIVTVLALCASVHQAVAQGTAFTYQGQLQNNGSPASGTYNLTFSLFPIASGGLLPQAGPVTNNGVVITNGLFTVTIDFGASVWNGQTNWLQIGVATNGVSTFTALTPRQQLTPTPYAIYSENAGSAAAVVANSVSAPQLLTPLAPSSGEVLAFSGSSLVWTNPTSLGGGGWSLTGNSGTTPGVNFLGTLDNEPLELWVNGASAWSLVPGSSYPNVVGGSGGSVASGSDGATIAGGLNNTVANGGSYGTVGGGFRNSVTNGYSTVSGGEGNTAGKEAVVGGGYGNTASAQVAVVSGGADNVASGIGAFLGGGGYDGTNLQGNGAPGPASVVGGGMGNLAQGSYSAVPGGYQNVALGTYSTVPGGSYNVASGDNSFAAGHQAQAQHTGSFVWADATGGAFLSTANDQFSARAEGGVRFVTGGNGLTGMMLDGYQVLTTASGGGGGGAGSTNGWLLTGNAGANPANGYFLGTIDTNGLELHVDGARALRLDYAQYFDIDDDNYQSINVNGGWGGNTILNGSAGATIAGGGSFDYDQANGPENFPNSVTGSFGTVGGGLGNTAGAYATVPGGSFNNASGTGSFAAGQNASASANNSFVWGDGSRAAASQGSNSFAVLATGGIGFFTAANTPNLWVGDVGGYGGAVGINTSTPRQALDVNGGYVEVQGNGAQAYIGGLGTTEVEVGSFNSAVTAVSFENLTSLAPMHINCSSISILGGADLAEPFKITSGGNDIPQGAVVVIDEENPGRLKLSDRPYDDLVAGVVSGANGINPGIQMQQQGLLEGGKNVALTGRVYVQADTSNGAIRPGDMLTTSSTPGHAMRISDHARAQGAILGKAMSGLKEGKGMVLVLVTLQ